MRYVVVYSTARGDRVEHGQPTDYATAVDAARRLGVGMPQRMRESIGIRLVRGGR